MNRFPYDAAERRARESGLALVNVCHAALPPGVPSRDHWGNYVTARTVYLGTPGTVEKDCAYGRVVHSIHQQATPSMADALHDIADALLMVRTFADRAAYEAYFSAGCRNSAERDAMATAWHDYSGTAQRATRCLPPELLTWLESLEA
jgi:hypothetical protein